MLVPLIMNIVRTMISVAVPLITPVNASNARPSGRVGSIVQLVISPAPDTAGVSGRSTVAVLFTIVKSSGE